MGGIVPFDKHSVQDEPLPELVESDKTIQYIFDHQFLKNHYLINNVFRA